MELSKTSRVILNEVKNLAECSGKVLVRDPSCRQDDTRRKVFCKIITYILFLFLISNLTHTTLILSTFIQSPILILARRIYYSRERNTLSP